MKRVIVTGATGLIGRALCALLRERGYAVIVFTRRPDVARVEVPGALAYVAWQPEQLGPWAEWVDGATAVVHLAGESIFTFGKRQTQASIRAETHSRMRTIQRLVHAMEAARVHPLVFVSASSVGTYGYAGFSDTEYTEESPAGTDFWGCDSQEWEAPALQTSQLGVRPVVLRTGYVLGTGPASGLTQQAEQVRRGFGGPVLPGRQWVPWVHIADVAGLIVFALEDERVRGPLNVVAPGVVRNREFTATLARVVGKPARFPVPGVLLRLGFGITADTIIHGRRVVPRKALDLGYAFRFAALEPAMRDLLAADSRQPAPATAS
jgi:uncharacterized protein (TIGR01777 family)